MAQERIGLRERAVYTRESPYDRECSCGRSYRPLQPQRLRKETQTSRLTLGPGRNSLNGLTKRHRYLVPIVSYDNLPRHQDPAALDLAVDRYRLYGQLNRPCYLVSEDELHARRKCDFAIVLLLLRMHFRSFDVKKLLKFKSLITCLQN